MPNLSDHTPLPIKPPDSKITQYLIRNKHKKSVQVFAQTVLFLMDMFEKIVSLPKRDVTAHVNWIHEEGVRSPYTVSGYAIRGNNAHSFSDIPWESVPSIIKKLDEDKSSITLRVDSNGGWFQEVPLNRWQRKKLKVILQRLMDENQ